MSGHHIIREAMKREQRLYILCISKYFLVFELLNFKLSEYVAHITRLKVHACVPLKVADFRSTGITCTVTTCYKHCYSCYKIFPCV